MIKIFHYLQYLFFPFFLLTIYFIIRGSLIEFNLELVGFGILCMGIAFAFTSMGDISKISKKEEKLFRNEKKFRRSVTYYMFMGLLILLTSLFFISQKWQGKGEMGEEFFKLGLNLSPLIIAVFFTLKQLVDKKEYYESMDKNREEELSTPPISSPSSELGS